MKILFAKIVLVFFAVTITSVFQYDKTFAQATGTVTDADGNTYRTLKIGNQTWMVENLRTTKYSDGTAIASSSGIGDLRKSTLPAFSDHSTENATNGHLYNWYAVTTKKLAPKGWRVPGKQDWDLLLAYLGGSSKAGDKMKAESWARSGTSGFDALPEGFLDNNGTFTNVGNAAFWWSTRERNGTQADYIKIVASLPSALSNGAVKQFFMSVRCIKND